MSPRRPAGVTLVAVLAWISGAINIVGGILALTGVISVPGVEGAAAWGLVIGGAVVFLVSLGLFRGSGFARILTAIAFLLNIGGSIYLLATHGWNNAGVLISAFASLLGLVFLFTGRANDFFRG